MSKIDEAVQDEIVAVVRAVLAVISENRVLDYGGGRVCHLPAPLTTAIRELREKVHGGAPPFAMNGKRFNDRRKGGDRRHA